ncbi:hypothetical protein RUMCAL_01052 [Ruminococcus callidus ATCC 27760]|uniref:Uncharacterized protein n=1 Tax=Ruminococcus callidus ATCC 27760 TaxID=411473 RepID=U2KDJ9_9FIRM|nr:hypothetical protein RUMCAL_01052 [Ruminococcus callidus ATCC 27760]
MHLTIKFIGTSIFGVQAYYTSFFRKCQYVMCNITKMYLYPMVWAN